MSLFKRQPSPQDPLTRGEALACVPMRNPQVQSRQNEAGELMLTYPTVFKPWFAALARRLGADATTERIKKLQLDAMGSATWKLVDGQSTVRSIVTRFARQYQLHEREAEVAVTQFLRELGRRGLIALR